MGKLLACNISHIANCNVSDNFSDSHHSAISWKLWWCHDMGRLSTLLALCEWNALVTGGILTQWAGDENIWCFLCCYREQTAGKTAELLVIWDAMMLTWHHWNIDGLVQERRNSSALAMELRLSCTNPSIYNMKHVASIPITPFLCVSWSKPTAIYPHWCLPFHIYTLNQACIQQTNKKHLHLVQHKHK